MCGIAGIIAKRESVHAGTLKILASSLVHRGPDDEGIEMISTRDRMVGLVHRRLAIIDLSPAGHQPMRDPTTGNWIVFNGEIYNYRALKEELEREGIVFISGSDTEVILKVYARWGTACLSRLRGMFAFALWDAKQQKLFCAVDRFGIKPLYFFHSGTTFAFASEVRALLTSGIVSKTIDPVAVHSFLSFGAVQAPATIIRNVRAMLPAQYFVYDAASGKVEGGVYWHPRRAPPLTPPRQGGESCDRFPPLPEGRLGGVGAVLEDTIRHHLVSDVPVALFLSGGVDSSALAILVNRVAGRTLDSFSVTFEEKEYAEGHYARLIGEKFCARHHEIKVSDGDLEYLLPAALDAQDQPTIDGVNAYVISKAVHDAGIKVVLSGQGGDEVFGGYPTFWRIPRMVRWWRLIRLLPRWKRRLLARMIGGGSVARSKFSQYLTSDGDIRSFYAIARQLFNFDNIRKLDPHGNTPHPNPLPQGEREIEGLDLFSTISVLEMRGYLANMLLRDGDVMSMAHGLEVRVPYLDHVLVERVMVIPDHEKLSRHLPKPLLLRAVQNEMPRAIWARKKMGFTFPWEVWLRGRLCEQVNEVLHDAKAAEVVGLDIHTCQNVWKLFLDHRGGVTWSRVWALYVLLRWSRSRLCA